ncbi:MAG TPA: 50S ribosomal protein L29 [Candidatus Nanoarchaeia archaeon]|nr:50S ribosomal protein L29 [Candidatus Nanoarchaeia archaeon]
MTKFKELSKLSKSDLENKINEIKVDLIKARVSASKGGKVKMKEMKKTLARLIMLKNTKTK